MFDLGVPFGIYIIFSVAWVVAYFAWAAVHHRRRGDE